MADTTYQPTPWLDVMLNEDTLLDGLAGIYVNNGWTKEAEFHKVVYPTKLTKPSIRRFYLPLAQSKVDLPKLVNDDYRILLEGQPIPVTWYTETIKSDGSIQLEFEQGVTGLVEIYYSDVKETEEFEFWVAKHIIIKNISGNLYGMTMLATFKDTIAKMGHKVPFATYVPNASWGTQLEPQDEGIFSYVVQRVEEESLFQRHTLNFYQMEKFAFGGNMVVGWDNPAEYRRVALDIEVQQTMWGLTGQNKSLQHKVTSQYPENYQSPIVVARTRIPQLEEYETIGDFTVKQTNWWDDSKVFVKGFVDGKSSMLIILADTAPIWNDNAVPAIPLYMGDFEPKGGTEETVKRDIVFEIQGETAKKSTIVTSKPMVNTGSRVKVWVTGGDSEVIEVKVAGETVGIFNVIDHTEPVTEKESAEYKGEFELTGLSGLNVVEVEVIGVAEHVRVFVEVFIETAKDGGGEPAALFSGTAFHKDKAKLEQALKDSAKFNYDDYSKENYQEIVLPVLKNYPHYPSNGVDSIMVKRTKYGARYQAYYFSWNTSSNIMPPLREDGATKAQHPRAWNSYDDTQYKYQFNPSKYSGKAHTSKALIVHPEDGVHGTLRNVILLSPLTIMNGDELKAVDEYCTDEGTKYKIYSYYLVEGISPLNKRPSTPYRPAAIGILKEGYVLPPLPPAPPAPTPFAVAIDPLYSRINAGESVDFTSGYSKHATIVNYLWSGSSDVNRGAFTVDGARFTFNKVGIYSVTFTASNELGQTGKATATIEVTAPPIPPPPPPPPPPPNTLQCGKVNDSGGGRLTEKNHELGANSGLVRIEYDMYGLPDRMDVYYQNQLLASTGGLVSNKGSLTFQYSPVGGMTTIKVVMTSDSNGTSWEYLVNCPV